MEERKKVKARGWEREKGRGEEKPLYEIGTYKNYVSFSPNSYIHWGKLLLFEHKAPKSLWAFYLEVSTWETEDSFNVLGKLLMWVLYSEVGKLQPRSQSSSLQGFFVSVLFCFCMACELSMVFISNVFFLIKKNILWHFTMIWNSHFKVCKESFVGM